ncbi:MAG: hypothetical protein Q3979_10105 [Actinomycetaceae bacterium]|nr:hypothetical protein [Actinomycetaceae bacterium]
MGFRFNAVTYSTRIPRQDIEAFPAGGRAEAGEAARRCGCKLTGQTAQLPQILGGGRSGLVYIGTWGGIDEGTIVVGGQASAIERIASDLFAAADVFPDGTKAVTHLFATSVADVTEFDVQAPWGSRSVYLAPGDDVEDSQFDEAALSSLVPANFGEPSGKLEIEMDGEPLPFEESLWNAPKEWQVYRNLPFHPEDYAQAAAEWLYGPLTGASLTVYAARPGRARRLFARAGRA